MYETVLKAEGPEGYLEACWLKPDTQSDIIILIIPGSGPVNRDGNNFCGLQTNAYKLLAEELASKGLASVRIDKRGLFGSAGAIVDANDVTLADYAYDIEQWIKVIRKHKPQSRIWILGHSEGGVVALKAASHLSSSISGMILLATPGRNLAEILRQQIVRETRDQHLIEYLDMLISRLLVGEQFEVTDLPSSLKALFNPAVQPYLIDFMRHDPAVLIKDIDLPILILQGTYDIQVHVEDAERLKSNNRRARLVMLDKTNHVLKCLETDSIIDNINCYQKPELPINPAIVEEILSFTVV